MCKRKGREGDVTRMLDETRCLWSVRTFVDLYFIFLPFRSRQIHVILPSAPFICTPFISSTVVFIPFAFV